MSTTELIRNSTRQTWDDEGNRWRDHNDLFLLMLGGNFSESRERVSHEIGVKQRRYKELSVRRSFFHCFVAGITYAIKKLLTRSQVVMIETACDKSVSSCSKEKM